MKVAKQIWVAVGIGAVVGAAAVAALALIPPASYPSRRLRLILLGLVFAAPMLQARFSRSLSGPLTLPARMCLAVGGAAACFVGALMTDLTLGGTRVRGGLWAIPLAWVIAALATELFLYLKQELA